MTKSYVNVEVLNGFNKEQVKVVAAVLVDPTTGLPIAGGGAPGKTIDFELLIIQDANSVTGVRREVRVDDTITVQYETLGGDPWVPVAPVTMVTPALPALAATAANQVAATTALGLANVALGTPNDASATSDSVAGSIISYLKRLSSLVTLFRAQLPATLGGKTAALSLSVTPATDANLSRETYSSITIVSITTDVVGTNYVTFGSQACTMLDIINNTGVDIEVRRGGAGNTLVIRDGYSRLMQGITNANGLQLRRRDQLNTAVTLAAEAFTV